jgi:acetyl-CoA carboxylase biotin carboxyl carrier protein
MRIDSDLVRDLAELLAANELTEIEVEDGDRKIKVKREAAPVMAYAPAAPMAAAPAPAAAASPAAATGTRIR